MNLRDHSRSELPCVMCGATTQIQQIATQDYAYAMNDDIFVYSQCATCMSWTQQMPPLNIADFYPSTYGNPNQKRRKLMHLTKSRKHRVLIRKLKTISTGSRLLDFGCGDAQFLMDCGDRKLELFGTDFDERRKPDVEKTGGVWIPHNELFHYSNNFDVVALFQVLEHLPNPRETLSLLRKCLVDGGLMVIETPSPSGLDYHCFATTYWGGFHAPRHFFIPSTSSMRELVEGIGFEVLEHRYIPSPYTWAETLKVAVSKFLPPRLVCRFFTLDNPFFLIPIAILEYATLWFGGSTSNQRLIARARPTSSR